MANPKRTLGVLHELRELGVGIAIDDFGTGQSSLAYLTTLPATELKIDKSFVLAIGADPTADSIVRSVIDLGRNLNLDIIAEGVETESAALALTDMGCRLAQGYLYSRPLEARAFEHWHANHDDIRSTRARQARTIVDAVTGTTAPSPVNRTPTDPTDRRSTAAGLSG